MADEAHPSAKKKGSWLWAIFGTLGCLVLAIAVPFFILAALFSSTPHK